jgi:hypothetical protein
MAPLNAQAAPRRCVAAAMSPEPYMCDPVFEAPGGLESGWRLQKIQQTWEGFILLVHYPSCHSFSKLPNLLVIYHLVMTNIAMERSTIFKFGKPSISMGHQQTMANCLS